MISFIRMACLVSILAVGAGLAGGCSAPQRLGERIADRLSCSSLCQARQPLERTLDAVAEMGYPYVDLSCLGWAPHVSVPDLLADFEQASARVESALISRGLRVSNLTFGGADAEPFEEYERQFRVVVRLANRLDTRLINLMAPARKADRPEMVRRLRIVQAIAADEGIRLTVETHVGQMTEMPADALWLCREVPGLGLTLDPSHYYAGENQGAGFDELYPLVLGTGFRAGAMSWAEIQLPWGEGPIDFAAMIHRLEAAGYPGFYVAEYIEGFNEVDPLTESRRFLEWARAL